MAKFYKTVNKELNKKNLPSILEVTPKYYMEVDKEYKLFLEKLDNRDLCNYSEDIIEKTNKSLYFSFLAGEISEDRFVKYNSIVKAVIESILSEERLIKGICEFKKVYSLTARGYLDSFVSHSLRVIKDNMSFEECICDITNRDVKYMNTFDYPKEVKNRFKKVGIVLNNDNCDCMLPNIYPNSNQLREEDSVDLESVLKWYVYLATDEQIMAVYANKSRRVTDCKGLEWVSKKLENNISSCITSEF